ncbi:unnamed protein product [Discula destructiva]
MPIKLNIQPQTKGVALSTPVPPPNRPAASAMPSAGSGVTMASSSPQAPSYSLPLPSQQKVSPPRNPQTPILPPITTAMPRKKSHAHKQQSPPRFAPEQLPQLQPPKQPQAQPQPQQQQQPHLFEEDEPRAPSYSPITPPSATTPPLIPERSNTGPPSSPNMAPPKTVTHVPPPVIPPNFASMGGRAPLTHNAHPPAVATASPPPIPLDPIDFEDNTDVIALKATIGILMRQKQQAEADIRQLRDAKNAAIMRPLDFFQDLTGGRISQGPPKTEDDDEDDEDDDDEAVDVDMKTEEDGAKTTGSLRPSAMGVKGSKKRKSKGKGKGKATASTSSSKAPPAAAAAAAAPRPWTNLPVRQNIARMPAINWSQYAVAGEALDKLHNQQLTHPTRGTPAVTGADGTFEFTGAANPDDGTRWEGISAPFDPLRDRVEQKKPAKGAAAPRGCD